MSQPKCNIVKHTNYYHPIYCPLTLLEYEDGKEYIMGSRSGDAVGSLNIEGCEIESVGYKLYSNTNFEGLCSNWFTNKDEALASFYKWSKSPFFRIVC